MPAAEPDNENEKDEQDETYTSRNAYGYNNSESQMKKGKDINKKTLLKSKKDPHQVSKM